MRIDAVVIHPVRLPFVGDFSHSLKTGQSAGNIVVEVIANGGALCGYGEGAPRAYVTGESIGGTLDNIRDLTARSVFPWDLADLDAIAHFSKRVITHRRRNAAVCALETALIDALGKENNKPALEFFSSDFKTDQIRYGAAIPLAGTERTTEIGRFIKDQLKIRRIKLKFDGDYHRNLAALEAIGKLFNTDCDLKVDVNCVWDLQLALAHLDPIRKYKVRVVEQPMMPNRPEIAEFAPRLKEMDVFLMADESACTLEETEALMAEGHYNMINVRLSKCGGLINSLRIIDTLRKEAVPFQVACQLGESGILSAAGRLLGLLCCDAAYYDGSYDEFLLKENVTTENVTFGKGGKAGPLPDPGLGITVSREKLKRLSAGYHSVEIPRP